MSKVIKNNDGVTIVEGTPAASLVKDSEKIFASKPPKKMAGENINRRIKAAVLPDFSDSQKQGRRPSFENLTAEEQAEVTARRERQMEERRLIAEKDRVKTEFPQKESPIRSGEKRRVDKFVKQQAEEEGRGRNDRRNEAKDKAESRRKRFFERRRSRKEAERSQTEQEATQGKFITTLGR